MPAEHLTVQDLRRRWKPHKERLNAQGGEQETNIRFHRACSWLQRAEQLADDPDLALLCRWTSFNALYGQWNHLEREPEPDAECWKVFLERMLALDETGHIGRTLNQYGNLVQAILEDEFNSRHFWKEPSVERATRARRNGFRAAGFPVGRELLPMLKRLFDRVYFLRCQLAHGGATHNSKLNRTSLKRCNHALDHLLRAFLLVWIDHGADENWGMMCYPPVRTEASAVSRS